MSAVHVTAPSCTGVDQAEMEEVDDFGSADGGAGGGLSGDGDRWVEERRRGDAVVGLAIGEPLRFCRSVAGVKVTWGRRSWGCQFLN